MLKEIRSPGLESGSEHGNGGACCAGCGRSIDDRYYLSAVDMCWHMGCLQCAECKVPLDAELTCYSRHGNIYCKQDYFRLFSMKRCARCLAGISACDLVMRARDLVYHVECFACYACGAILCKGDYYGIRDGAVYCRLDYERLKHRDLCELEPMCSPPRAAGHHWPAAHKGRPRKKRNVQLSPMTTECNGLTELNVLRIPQSTLEVMQATDLSSSMESLTYETSSLSSPTNPSTAGAMSQQHHQQQQGRTKRMRTSFKHHQLRTMKSYFNINQNPDAKDLKQLAQKTGLSKRVLQVWFQNARAKWRRNITRQENNQLVASSISGQNQSTPSDPDLIRGHTQGSQGLNFVDLF
ncbi:LIM/homeobox protein Lhx2-like [Adelges cooleyi]|uniref:LIM/homeobox protein Lhx2-like n=1 Tax=Adelges cooleyi TaxID=133065 RepID=UPI0021800F9F|nr:LIM/homeobox protein Lhx2-like [Adelges cooleyi]